MQAEPNFDHEVDMPADDSATPTQTKQKWIVAILLGVLLVALLCQPGDEDPPTETSAMVSLKADDEAGGIQSPATAGTGVEGTGVEGTGVEGTVAANGDLSRFVNTRQLSRIALDEVLVSPVFAAERIDPPRVEPSRVTVQAVYGSQRQQSAILGDTIVRSGQPLPDGRTVLSVTPQGVKLSQ